MVDHTWCLLHRGQGLSGQGNLGQRHCTTTCINQCGVEHVIGHSPFDSFVAVPLDGSNLERPMGQPFTGCQLQTGNALELKAAFVVVVDQCNQFLYSWRLDFLGQHFVVFLKEILKVEPHFAVKLGNISARLASGDCVDLGPMICKTSWPPQFIGSVHLPTGFRHQFVRVLVDYHVLHDLPVDVLIELVAVSTVPRERAGLMLPQHFPGEARQLRRPLDSPLKLAMPTEELQIH